MSELFGASPEVKYKNVPGSTTTVTITKNTSSTSSSGSELESGFLADTFSLQYQRPASLKYFLNGAAVYEIGYGSGTLTLQGLLGTATQTAELLSSDIDGCTTLWITLEGAFLTTCAGSDATNTKIIAKKAVPTALSVQSSIQQNGLKMQTSSVQFTFTGLETE